MILNYKMTLTNYCNKARTICVIIINVFCEIFSYTVSDANNLHTTIFTGYNKLVLPDYPVTMQIQYNLLTINSLDIKTQTISTSGWFTVAWTDRRLSWTPSVHGNIDHIYASQKVIWHPELIVDNSITDLTNLGEDNLQAKINYTGVIRWEPSAILTTSCDMDVRFFPYDIQTCDIELSSWGFHTDAVNLTFYKSNVNLQDYRANGEWDLISTSQHTSEITDDGLVYKELFFRIVVQRLPGYYIMSIIFPVCLTSILTAVTFILPVESGEKLGYILTVLVALTVFLTLFADIMPSTSKHTSVLAVFLTVTLGLASLVIIITILIIRLYHKPDDYTVPDWLYRMVYKLKKRPSTPQYDRTFTECTSPDDVRPPRKGKPCLDKIKTYEKFSSKELAHSLDSFCFIVFVVLHVLVLLCFTITLSVTD